jgi:hypothetical protein
MTDTTTALLTPYAIMLMEWANARTKTEMLVMIGIFMLGHYFGSKRHARTKPNV